MGELAEQARRPGTEVPVLSPDAAHDSCRLAEVMPGAGRQAGVPGRFLGWAICCHRVRRAAAAMPSGARV
jgi:hypothetical protein